MIYLDNNATTAIDPAVVEAMMKCFAIGPLNASSQHAIGRAARKELDAAVSEIGRLLGADVDSPGGDSLVLTSGGSESNNLALMGIGDANAPLVVSSIEHPSVLAVASSMHAQGREVRVLPVTDDGVVDLSSAKNLISQLPKPGLVSVMSANNETGVIQPIPSLAEICRSLVVPLHVDATQTIGKLPFDFETSGIAAVTFTAHKFHGPAGIGGLLLRAGLSLRPMLLGGEQQFGKRPGTEAVPLVVGMAKALGIAIDAQTQVTSRLRQLRDRMETELATAIHDLIIHGKGVDRLPGTSCFSLPQVDRQAMLMALDLAGLACSSGSACASGSSRPSHVLEAMRVPEIAINSAIRLGMSKFSTEQDIRMAIDTICRQQLRLRKLSMVEKSE